MALTQRKIDLIIKMKQIFIFILLFVNFISYSQQVTYYPNKRIFTGELDINSNAIFSLKGIEIDSLVIDTDTLRMYIDGVQFKAVSHSETDPIYNEEKDTIYFVNDTILILATKSNIQGVQQQIADTAQANREQLRNDIVDTIAVTSLDELDGTVNSNVNFALGGNTVTWTFTNPVGGMLFNFTGGWSGHALEILDNSNVPNGSAGDHVVHIGGSGRQNVVLLHLDSPGDTALKVSGITKLEDDLHLGSASNVKQIILNDTAMYAGDILGGGSGNFTPALINPNQNGVVFGDGSGSVYSSKYLQIDTTNSAKRKFFYASEGNNINNGTATFNNQSFFYADTAIIKSFFVTQSDSVFTNYFQNASGFIIQLNKRSGAVYDYQGFLQLNKASKLIRLYSQETSTTIKNQLDITKTEIQQRYGTGTTPTLITSFSNDSAWFKKKIVSEDTIKSNVGFKFPDGQLLTTIPDSTWKYGEFEDSVKVNQISSTPHQITYATSITFNGNNGMNQYVILTGNITSCSFSNMKRGATYTFEIIQDATGSRTFDETGLDYKANESADFSMTANDENLMVIFCDRNGNLKYSISTYTP